MGNREFPVPPFFDPARVSSVWRVPYQERAAQAEDWAREHGIRSSEEDSVRISLLLVDVQNTFCIPDFELYVGGRTGTAAVDDNRRLCEFIYRNLGWITEICPTMDTHQATQVFHSIFLVNKSGEHPPPFTLVTREDIEQEKWRFNPSLSSHLGVGEEEAGAFLRHYTRQLEEGGKYDLTIWPYHAILGGIGHALVSSVEEAIFFHSIARFSQPDFEVKGNHPLTENYSVLRPEVLTDPNGLSIAEKNQALIEKLIDFDALVVAGQAKSHCVAWTIEDLLQEIASRDDRLAGKIYLLEDCSSPVVIPGVIDYTETADRTFQKFAEAGMHLVRTTDPIGEWPGIPL